MTTVTTDGVAFTTDGVEWTTGDVADPANLAVTIDGTTAQLSWDASPVLT